MQKHLTKCHLSQRIQSWLLKCIDEMHADTSSVDFKMAGILAAKDKKKKGSTTRAFRVCHDTKLDHCGSDLLLRRRLNAARCSSLD